MSQRIACLGGGPAGLFFAMLAKRRDPSREVTLFERNRAEDTFGFGVVFSDATLLEIHHADPVVRTALDEHGVHWDPIEVRLKGEKIRCGGNGMAAVARKTLLAMLQDGAAKAGADLRFQTEADADELLDVGYDLVVAGDGSNSGMRTRHPNWFVPSVETASAKFIWFGTTYPFTGLTFVHERGPHGVFAVHGYPIGEGVSTFIVETDEASWRAAGLDAFDEGQVPGTSDMKSKLYLEQLFAEQIDGHPLLVNNSRWANFKTWRTGAWSHGRTVLLGDAAHTAHFSVGSGTKMAMEDAVALVDALDRDDGDLGDALASYEADRRPLVEKIQNSAGPSLSWWEHFGRYHDVFEPWQFAYHFLSRSINDAQLVRRDPGFVESSHAEWRARYGAEPLASHLQVAGVNLGDRIVPLRHNGAHMVASIGECELPLLPTVSEPGSRWGLWIVAPSDEKDLAPAQKAMDEAVKAGVALIAVTGGSSLTRRLLAERARLVCGVVSMIIAEHDASIDWARTTVLSGRADLIAADPATIKRWKTT